MCVCVRERYISSPSPFLSFRIQLDIYLCASVYMHALAKILYIHKYLKVTSGPQRAIM